jgi:hypothetical protein
LGKKLAEKVLSVRPRHFDAPITFPRNAEMLRQLADNTEKMADDAMPLMNKNRTSIVAPKREVRHSGGKD